MTTYRELGNFNGSELSKDELKYGYISYATFATSIEMFLIGENISQYFPIEDLEEINPDAFWSAETNQDVIIFDSALVHPNSIKTLTQMLPDEPILYNKKLNIYIWCITFPESNWNKKYTTISIDSPDSFS